MILIKKSGTCFVFVNEVYDSYKKYKCRVNMILIKKSGTYFVFVKEAYDSYKNINIA